MNKAFFALAIYATSFLAISCNNSGFPHKLDLKKGQQATYTYDIMQVNEAQNPETSETVTTTGRYTYTSNLKVTEVKDNSFITEVNYADVVIRATAKGMPEGIDTTMNMENLTGKGAEIIYDETGRATATQKQDAVSNEAQSMMILMLEFSKELFLRFPSDDMNGKNWTVERSDSMDQFGSRVFIKTKSDYTHVADIDTLGYNCAVVEYKMTASDFQVKNELAILMGFEMSMNGKGSATGKAYIDKKTGLTVLNRENLIYDMNMVTKANNKTETAPMKVQYSIYNVLKK